MPKPLDYASPRTQRPCGRWDRVDLFIGVTALATILLHVVTIPLGLSATIAWTMAPLLPCIAALALVIVASVTIVHPRPLPHRRLRLSLIALLAAMAAMFWFANGFARLWDLNMRRRVAGKDRDALVAWARQTLATPPPGTVEPPGTPRFFPRRSLNIPSQHQNFGYPEYDAWIETDAQGVHYIRLCGSIRLRNLVAFALHGDEVHRSSDILIGPPGWVPTSTKGKYQWADGVWNQPGLTNP